MVELVMLFVGLSSIVVFAGVMVSLNRQRHIGDDNTVM